MAEWWRELLVQQVELDRTSGMPAVKGNAEKFDKSLLKSSATYKVTSPNVITKISHSKRAGPVIKESAKSTDETSCSIEADEINVLKNPIKNKISILKTMLNNENNTYAPLEKNCSPTKNNIIHCRLCDNNITGQSCHLLFDYNEDMETRLGRKINIILNAKENYTNLSNYCCNVCASKIQICFSLLVEIQASDEVIRQTYQHLSEREEVNTNTQTFICEECSETVTGIKLFIRHYENHILQKTVDGSRKDLKITEIVEIFNDKEKKETQDAFIKSEPVLDTPKDGEFEYIEDELENKEEEGSDIPNPFQNENLEMSDEEDNMETAEDENVSEGTDFDLDEDEADDDSPEDEDLSESQESLNSNDSYNKLVKVVKRILEKSDRQGTTSKDNSTDTSQYICDYCDSGFDNKTTLTRHVKKCQDKANKIRSRSCNMKSCRFCKDWFKPSELKRHVPLCKEEFLTNGNVLCHTCGETFKYKQWLVHRKKHNKFDSSDGWGCELCGKKFKAKRFLKSHYGEHDESKKKICEICGKKLLPLSFFSHMLKHKEKRHVCQFCGKGFTYNYSLKIHQKVHENGNAPKVTNKRKKKLYCWFCKTDFESSSALNNHLKDKHNAQDMEQDSRFPCSECDKRFADMFTLKAHLKLMHEMKDEEVARFKSLPVYRFIECNVCKVVFNSENKIRIHMKQEHGLKPFEMEILKKECEKCGKRFASKQNLLHHINGAHLHIKPMTCDICQEKFAKHSSLIYHKLRHSGDKPFQCEFCKKAYRQRNDVIRHLARHVRDNELDLEEASAVNTSPSPLVIKRRIFLKDSSINYQSVVRKSRKNKSKGTLESVIEEEPNWDEISKVEYEEEVDAEEMVETEEVTAEEFQFENPPAVQFIRYVQTIKPVFNQEQNTIILSSPDEAKNSRNVTYRSIPSQLKHMPAVIVKKQEQI